MFEKLKAEYKKPATLKQKLALAKMYVYLGVFAVVAGSLSVVTGLPLNGWALVPAGIFLEYFGIWMVSKVE